MLNITSKLYGGIFFSLIGIFIVLFMVLVIFPISLPNISEQEKKKTLYDNFENGTYKLELGKISPDGKWASIYTGFGSMGVERDHVNKGNNFFEIPQESLSSNVTHSSLATTTKKYSDFDLTLDAMNVKQLRKNSPPNPWESVWIMWHYTDNFHWYALQLKTNGIQLEKKDNDVKNDASEIFLVTKSSPVLNFGAWHKVRILHQDSNTFTPHIQIWIDNEKVIDYVDNKTPNSETLSKEGAIGLYTEDAYVRFDNIYIKPL